MDLRRSTELSLLAGRDFASQRDPYAPLRTAELGALLDSAEEEGVVVEEAALELSWQCIELAGAQALGRSLRKNRTVTSLNLSCNALGDGGALALAESLRDAPGSALRVLNLSQNKLQDAGAAAVASLIQSASLEEVALNGNEIGDLGADALAQAVRKCSTLRKLWLGDNMIGERGAESLADSLAESNQIEVLWVGKQRPTLKPYPTPSVTPHGRVDGAIAAINQRFAQELTRKEHWKDLSDHGHVLAESVDNNVSSMARLERHAFELRNSFEQQSAGVVNSSSDGSRSSRDNADGASTKLAQLNASNEELQCRINAAKQGLQRLDAATGARGFAAEHNEADLAKRASGMVTSLPVDVASTVRGLRFAPQPCFEPSAPLEWNAQHPQPALKPRVGFEKERAPTLPRQGPSMVEGSLPLAKPSTTGAWPPEKSAK